MKSKESNRLELSEYKFPEVTALDFAFSTFEAPKILVDEANQRDLENARRKFSDLFFNGGKFRLKDDVKGTWKESAFLFARALMGSFEPSHEDKEAVCALIFDECLEL